jgi:general secretion pathway protein G
MMASASRRGGFTLVELLIVVVVLGILAGIVLPSFNTSTEDTKVSAAVRDLQTLRASVDLYKVQHDDVYPGYPVGGGTPTETLLINQLTLASKRDGSTAALGTATFNLGPYLKTGIPANPFNGLKTVTIINDGVAFPTAATDATGWIFKPQTGELRCNSTVTTSGGQDVFDF